MPVNPTLYPDNWNNLALKAKEAAQLIDSPTDTPYPQIGIVYSFIKVSRL